MVLSLAELAVFVPFALLVMNQPLRGTACGPGSVWWERSISSSGPDTDDT